MLAARGGSALLFDEMEDLIGDADPGEGDWMRGRRGSKLWVNRQIETNAVPVIWTTNAVGNIDPAILRRMSFVLRLDPPAGKGATAMIGRIAQEEHKAIVDAIAARNQEAAGKALRDHISIAFTTRLKQDAKARNT